MDRIRVDTDKLKAGSKEFESAAETFAQVGKDILSIAAGLPSYDGQLSTPARAAALEVNRQCQEVSACYSRDAESLQKIAHDFENVDNQTIGIIKENMALISDSPIYGGPGGENDAPSRQGGSPNILGFDFLAYKDYGDYVIFWRNGKTTTIIVTIQNRSLVQQYEDDLDEFFKNLTGFLSTIQNLLLAKINMDKIIAVFALLIGADILSVGLIDQIPGINAIAVKILTAAGESARDMNGLSTFDIVKKCGAILDPINPTKYLGDVEKFILFGQGTSRALEASETDWAVLVPPPTPSGATPVPVPTPPTPTPTPTPKPTPEAVSSTEDTFK